MFCVACLTVLAACVPAQTPPQLAYTPGPAVVVTDRVYESSAFTVHYPSGWRVVTGAADAPPSVVFVAPDEVSTIALQVGPLDNSILTEPGFSVEIRGIELANGRLITAIAQAPEPAWESFLPVFEGVIATVRQAS